MEPRIERWPARRLCGVRAVLRASRGGILNAGVIAPLWEHIRSHAPSLEHRVGAERFAVITGDVPGDLEETAHYHALVEVTEAQALPEGWIEYDLPASRVAAFVHRGSPRTLSATTRLVFGQWLPCSTERVRQPIEVIVLPPGFDPTAADAELRYCLLLR